MNALSGSLHKGGLIKFKSVRAKLLSAFAVVTVLTLVLGLVGLQQQNKLFDEVKTARDHDYDSAHHVCPDGQRGACSSASTRRSSRSRPTRRPADRSRPTSKLQDAKVDKNVSGLSELNTTARDPSKSLATFKVDWPKYKTARDTLVVTERQGGQLPARGRRSSPRSRRIYSRGEEDIDNLQTAIVKQADASYADARRASQSSARTLAIVIMLIVAAIAIGLGVRDRQEHLEAARRERRQPRRHGPQGPDPQHGGPHDRRDRQDGGGLQRGGRESPRCSRRTSPRTPRRWLRRRRS